MGGRQARLAIQCAGDMDLNSPRITRLAGWQCRRQSGSGGQRPLCQLHTAPHPHRNLLHRTATYCTAPHHTNHSTAQHSTAHYTVCPLPAKKHTKLQRNLSAMHRTVCRARSELCAPTGLVADIFIGCMSITIISYITAPHRTAPHLASAGSSLQYMLPCTGHTAPHYTTPYTNDSTILSAPHAQHCDTLNRTFVCPLLHCIALRKSLTTTTHFSPITSLHRTTPHSTMPHRTAPHCTVSHSTAPRQAAEHSTAPHCTALHRTTLYRITPRRPSPHRTMMHRTPHAPHRTAPHTNPML